MAKKDNKENEILDFEIFYISAPSPCEFEPFGNDKLSFLLELQNNQSIFSENSINFILQLLIPP